MQQQDGANAIGINQQEQESPSQTLHMDAGPSSCSARMLTVADMRAESHTFYPERATGKSYLNALSALQIASISPQHPHVQEASKTSTLA